MSNSTNRSSRKFKGCELAAAGTSQGVSWEHWSCESTEAKVEMAQSIALESAGHPVVRRAAELAAAGARSPLEQAQRIHAWVQEHVLFTDEVGELFTRPERLLETRAGDCDDHAMLVAAMLTSMGLQAAITFYPPRHVVAEWRWRGQWLPLETTIEANFGEDPQRAATRLSAGRDDIVSS